ncbi:hypothetical protein Pelo_16629 [Pelomyxa schiedti]|nr:hypothetical protein Pelo_16629 [Pelomyxa schiedti]
MSWSFLGHHIIGAMGLMFVVSHRIGGTLILGLLLDWSPAVIDTIAYRFSKRSHANSRVVWVIYFTVMLAMRVFVYIWLLVRGTVQAFTRATSSHNLASGIFSILLCGWALPAAAFSWSVVRATLTDECPFRTKKSD